MDNEGKALIAWMSEHGACDAPPEVVTDFDTYLSALPWIGNGIDWRTLPHDSLPLDPGVTDDDIVAWVTQQSIGRHPLALVLGKARTGIIAPLLDVFRDLDLLQHSLGRLEMYVCGARANQGQVEAHYPDFIEQRFTGSYTLHAHRSSASG